MTTMTEQAYEDARAAADAAYKAVWASPRDKTILAEYERLATKAHKAKLALQAETGKAIIHDDPFAQEKVLARQAHLDREDY